MKTMMIAVMAVAMVGCVSMRDPAIEARIAAMPEGAAKTEAMIQYEQLKSQRAIAYNQPYGWLTPSGYGH